MAQIKKRCRFPENFWRKLQYDLKTTMVPRRELVGTSYGIHLKSLYYSNGCKPMYYERKKISKKSGEIGDRGRGWYINEGVSVFDVYYQAAKAGFLNSDH